MHTGAIPPFTMRLFGPFHTLCGGQALPPLRSQKGKWLLAILTLQHSRELQRNWVADLLWPDAKNPLGSLNTCLHDLRQALGADAIRITSTARTLCLDLTGADVDLIAFEDAIRRGDLPALRKAIALYTGPLLQDCSEPWVLPEREERTNAYLIALETLTTQALTDGERDYAIECLHKAIDVEVIQEKTHRRLMNVLADAHDYMGAMKIYRDLADRRKREDLGPVEDATTALYDHIRQRSHKRVTAPVRPPAPIANASPPNLHRPLTELLGREQELKSLVARIPSTRLTTLTGPGGVGKSRMATEAALELTADFAHGVHLVMLEALTDPVLIPQQVAKTLGVEGQPGRTWNETLVHFLRGRQLLLVLDNAEHLLDTCADCARKLLSACPGLHLLVTSRERLGLLGEVVRPLPPLAVPNTDVTANWRQWLDYSAIHLFCQRAAAVRPDFELSPQNLQDVVLICRRLDGLPLAIELAAALVESLSVRDIVKHLDQRFRLLQTGDRTASPRHQALKATLDWSYDQLTPNERRLLCSLCIFSGGWTLAAVEALFPMQASKGQDTVNLLSRLVAKSLILSEVNCTETRYGMLETIREYGREILSDVVLWKSIRQVHCEYYAVLAETAASGLLGPTQVECLDRLEREHPNLRAALLWATGENGNPCLALRLGGALWRFWYARGYHKEGQNWLKSILQVSSEQSASLRLVVSQGLGNLYYAQREHTAARPCFEQCLALAKDLKDRRAQASALASLANVEVGDRNYARARGLFEEGLLLFEELADAYGTALTVSNLAMLACQSEQDYTTAREFHLRGLALFRDLGALYHIAHECNNLAYTLVRLREAEAAYVYLDESMGLSRTLANPFLLAHSLTNYIGLAMFEGHHERAAVLMGADAALRTRIEVPLSTVAIIENKQDERILRSNLGDEAFTIHRMRGQNMTEDEVRAYVLARNV